MAQDKELALGVGIAALSRDDIKKINNDKGVLLGCALDGTKFTVYEWRRRGLGGFAIVLKLGHQQPSFLPKLILPSPFYTRNLLLL